jgi:hypothetical protein
MLQFQPPLWNGFEITLSENGFLKFNFPQYEFPIQLSRHLMLMSAIEKIFRAENKEEQLNQLLQDSGQR